MVCICVSLVQIAVWLDKVGDGWMEWSSLHYRLYSRNRLRSNHILLVCGGIHCEFHQNDRWVHRLVPQDIRKHTCVESQQIYPYRLIRLHLAGPGCGWKIIRVLGGKNKVIRLFFFRLFYRFLACLLMESSIMSFRVPVTFYTHGTASAN